MSGTPEQTVYSVRESAFRVRDIPERLRPREEADRVGVENAGDVVLLAIILRSGTRGVNVVDLAAGLMQHYGYLSAIAGTSVDELARFPGMGRVKAQSLLAALELGQRVTRERLPERTQVRTPEDAARHLRNHARKEDKEVFWVLHLDTKNRLKREPEAISRGLLDASLVHPREVFREAIRQASAAVVVAHNHPSGDPTPSAEDVRITRQLVEAGRILDIGVLDHIILGKPMEGRPSDLLSMREQGIVEFGS